MKRDLSRLRQDILRVEESRAPHVQALLAIRDAILRGSFVTLHRKCGKPTCHCADGDGHPAKYLSIKEQGRTRLIYVGAGDELRVAEGVARQRTFRQSRAELARLSSLVLELLDTLEQQLTQPPPTRASSRGRVPKKR